MRRRRSRPPPPSQPCSPVRPAWPPPSCSSSLDVRAPLNVVMGRCARVVERSLMGASSESRRSTQPMDGNNMLGGGAACHPLINHLQAESRATSIHHVTERTRVSGATAKGERLPRPTSRGMGGCGDHIIHSSKDTAAAASDGCPFRPRPHRRLTDHAIQTTLDRKQASAAAPMGKKKEPRPAGLANHRGECVFPPCPSDDGMMMDIHHHLVCGLAVGSQRPHCLRFSLATHTDFKTISRSRLMDRSAFYH